MRAAARILPACAALLVLLVARSAPAQGTRTFSLTLTGGPLLFTSPTAADFVAGSALHPTGLTFLIDLTGSAPPPQTFQAAVSIRSSSATLGGNGKSIADLEWSLGSAAGPWTPLTTSDVTVDSRPMQRSRLNDPWGDTIHFRMRLAWDTDVPASYSAGIVITLTVTGP